MNSAIYTGHVRHRRFTPKTRVFRHSIRYLYLDLAEIPALFDRRLLLSMRAPALLHFRRSAFLGPRDLPLDEAVRRKVEEASGRRPRGPIRLLTQIGAFGITFNPVSFYYCFDETGDHITDIVAEITNTPWGERYAYVLRAENGADFEFEKRFHVSPFLDMDQRYRWRFSAPGGTIAIQMENRAVGASESGDSSPIFDATLTLRRRAWSPRALAANFLFHPFHAIGTLALIYAHAFVIWARGIPFVPHPAGRGEPHPRGDARAIPSLSGEPPL